MIHSAQMVLSFLGQLTIAFIAGVFCMQCLTKLLIKIRNHFFELKSFVAYAFWLKQKHTHRTAISLLWELRLAERERLCLDHEQSDWDPFAYAIALASSDRRISQAKDSADAYLWTLYGSEGTSNDRQP